MKTESVYLSVCLVFYLVTVTKVAYLISLHLCLLKCHIFAQDRQLAYDMRGKNTYLNIL